MKNSTSQEFDSWAYLKITSKLPYESIVEKIGFEAEGRHWSVGDPRRHPQQKPYDFSLWTMESGRARGEPLDAHLKALWRRMQQHKDRILSLPSNMELCVQCVAWFETQDTPLLIAGGHFSTAAFYLAKFDFDFYFEDDFGDDEGGKPYWKW